MDPDVSNHSHGDQSQGRDPGDCSRSVDFDSCRDPHDCRPAMDIAAGATQTYPLWKGGLDRNIHSLLKREGNKLFMWLCMYVCTYVCMSLSRSLSAAPSSGVSQCKGVYMYKNQEDPHTSYIYICIYIHTYIHKHLCYIYIYAHTNKHVYIYIYSYIYMYTFIFILICM